MTIIKRVHKYQWSTEYTNNSDWTVSAEWCDAYRKQCPNVKLLQKEIDDYMAEFDSKVEQVSLQIFTAKK